MGWCTAQPAACCSQAAGQLSPSAHSAAAAALDVLQNIISLEAIDRQALTEAVDKQPANAMRLERPDSNRAGHGLDQKKGTARRFTHDPYAAG
jgi:hypothetical protein